MFNTSSYKVTQDHDATRLDVFLAEVSKLSRSQIKKLVDHEQVLVDDVPAKKTGHVMRPGMKVRILKTSVTTETTTPHIDTDTSLYSQIEIIHEEKDYLVVYKPAGLLVHPTMAEEPVTLTAWLVKHVRKIKNVGEDPTRPGIVHRLDRHASGLLVVPKTQKMYEHLKEQFQEREVKKYYTVLVHGTIEKDYDTINFDIDRGHDGKMVARPKLKEVSLETVDDIQTGKKSLTEFTVTKRFARYTLLDVRIHSGRTHQIRVHMYAYAHPVVGDILYFNKKFTKKHDPQIDRLFLHARTLCFTDLNGEEQCFQKDIPHELQAYLDALT